VPRLAGISPNVGFAAFAGHIVITRITPTHW
jgi:hypothetical protein